MHAFVLLCADISTDTLAKAGGSGCPTQLQSWCRRLWTLCNLIKSQDLTLGCLWGCSDPRDDRMTTNTAHDKDDCYGHLGLS